MICILLANFVQCCVFRDLNFCNLICHRLTNNNRIVYARNPNQPFCIITKRHQTRVLISYFIIFVGIIIFVTFDISH
jgi:hypothetical protein